MAEKGARERSGETQGGLTQDQLWQLLLEVREGSEVGQMLAGMRPQRDALGHQLGLWLDLLTANLSENTTRAALPLVEAQEARRRAQIGSPPSGEPDDDVQLTAWRAADGTPAARDLTAWRAAGFPEDLLQPYREQDEGPVLRFAHRVMDAAVDNLRGVAVLMRDARVDRPPLALSRVVLDAAAHLHHVLKPGLEHEERLVRVLNESLARAGEDFRAAQRERDFDRVQDAEQEIGTIREAVGDRRPAQWKPERAPAPYIGDKPVYTSKMIKDLLGDGAIWNSLSGVVHNKEDESWRIWLGLALGLDNPHKGQYIALHSFGAVLGIVTLTELIEEYTGWDLSATRQCNESLCGLWAAGAGMADGDYREQARQTRLHDGSTERLAREFAEARAHIEAQNQASSGDV